MSHKDDKNLKVTSKNQSKNVSVSSTDNTTDKDYQNVEPLPESERPRKDGPGGE